MFSAWEQNGQEGISEVLEKQRKERDDETSDANSLQT